MTAEALAPSPGADASTPLLSLRNIQKSFGAVHVLRGVDLDVRAGQVTALVGDNGAGKSTLIKGVAGIHAFDEGEYLFEGQPVHVHGPKDANALGIEVVYQDLALCDNLDVVQNMFLGREMGSVAALDEDAMEARARETLDGLSVRTLQSVRQAVASLSGGQRQTVAIARSVLWNSKLVVLDEPTAALGVAQTEQVLRLVRRLADNGLGVILISHNLNDIFEVADDIAVLYLGAMVAQVTRADVTSNQVVELITSRPLRRHGPQRPGRRAGGGGPVTTQTQPQRRIGRTRRARAPAAFVGRPRRHRPRLRHQGTRGRPRVSAGHPRPDRARRGVLRAQAGPVPQPVQRGEPAQPVRRHRRALDGPGVRAAARRDRPVGRLHRRHGGGGHGRGDDRARLAVDPVADRPACSPAR